MSFLESIGDIDVNVCIEWKISNFLSLSVEEGFYYISPTFHISNNSFHLRLYPAGERGMQSEFISVYVENENRNACYVKFSLSIKKTDGSLIGTLTSTNVKLEPAMGFRQFYRKSLLQENDLTILCILKLLPDEEQDIESEQHLHEDKALDLDHKQLKELDELSRNLKNLYANKDSCDIIFRLRNKEFRAHKAILMARSPVFAAMFQHDTLEKQTGFIDIPDCDPDSFPHFLEYLYCGCLEDTSFDIVFHLYSTSIKYDVQKLKEFCIEYLIENLTIDNICDTIILADRYDEVKLFSGALNFFNENFSKIVLTAEWVNLLKNDYRLANKLLIELSKTTASKA